MIGEIITEASGVDGNALLLALASVATAHPTAIAALAQYVAEVLRQYPQARRFHFAPEAPAVTR